MILLFFLPSLRKIYSLHNEHLFLYTAREVCIRVSPKQSTNFCLINPRNFDLGLFFNNNRYVLWNRVTNVMAEAELQNQFTALQITTVPTPSISKSLV